MIKKEKPNTECCDHKHHVHNYGGGGDSGMIYCLGVAGALFYFLKGATTFGAVMLGTGKAFVWPAILMFKLLTYLQI